MKPLPCLTHRAVLLLTAGLLSGECPGAPSLRTGEDLLKADLLSVFAHPDDETGAATTLAHYALVEGRRLVNVYCTRGEGGGNMVGRQWGPSLGILRESELRACLATLGVERVYFLNQRDWAYTESAQMTLEAWEREPSLEALVRVIRLTRPEVLVTMNPAPTPGQHGHHQAAGILAVEAFRLAADPEAFPNQIRDEGLETWQIRKLYVGGPPDPFGATIESTANTPDGRNVAKIAGEALSHHRSQGFGRMADAPWLARPRSYSLLKSTVGLAAGETNLFERVSAPASTAPASIPPTPRPVWFVGSPAEERFKTWCRHEGVNSLAENLRAEVSIAAGEERIVELRRDAGSGLDWNTMQLQHPDDWMVSRLDTGNRSDILSLKVRTPEGDPAEGTLTASGPSGTDTAPIRAEIHIKVVPRATSSRTAKPPQIGPIRMDDWTSATVLSIPSTRVWQGSADSDQDVSARCHILHDDDFLYVLVDVQDDRVVRNIAPNDVRGHWRSDSVEICIDPAGDAEHTLRSFKVGVFPFTTDGHPGAARDADANQGPINRTAPGMRIASRETGTGYQIATAIPRSALGLPIEPGRPIGFNVLIYDGDKQEADLGENINECRIAWSPGRGVQGRPIYWGKLMVR